MARKTAAEPVELDEAAPAAPDALAAPDSPVLVDVGFNVNELLRTEPADVAVTFDALTEPSQHLSLARFGYLEFGGGLFYRPTGFDLDQGAVICTRVSI